MKVLIVTYRRPDLLKSCVSNLERYFAMSDLLVIDNHSEDSAAVFQYCATAGIAIIRNDENEGFAKAINKGMRLIQEQSGDPWVLLLNPDAEVLTDPRDLTKSAQPTTACITTFNAAAEHPWDCEKPIPNPWRAAWEDSGFGRFRLPQPLGRRYRSFRTHRNGYLVGCYLLVSSKAWQRVGPFDERFWLYSEEVDWCLRAHQAGLDCVVAPIMGYRHEAGQTSTGSAASEHRATVAYWESRALFLDKHWGRIGTGTYRTAVTALGDLRRILRAGRSFFTRPDLTD